MEITSMCLPKWLLPTLCHQLSASWALPACLFSSFQTVKLIPTTLQHNTSWLLVYLLIYLLVYCLSPLQGWDSRQRAGSFVYFTTVLSPAQIHSLTHYWGMNKWASLGRNNQISGVGNVRKAISLWGVGILICKMRIHSTYFTGIEGMAAQCGRSTNKNYYHYYYYSGINSSPTQMPSCAELLLWEV